MLVGVSLVLHGALAAVAVFLVRPNHPIEDMPLAVELAFEAPATTAENAGAGPAGLIEAERPPLPLAMPDTAPVQPLLNQPDVPLLAPEPVPSSPEQTSQSEPEQVRPVIPVPATTAPPRQSSLVSRPVPKPARRPVPQDRVPSPATPNQSGIPPSPASSGIPDAPQHAAPLSEAWRGALAAWVQSRKRYPDEARRRGIEGTVGVRFTVARDGQVLDAQIVQGSGSDLLDQAALAMFRGARAPQFPANMGQQQVSITVAVRYRFAE